MSIFTGSLLGHLKPIELESDLAKRMGTPSYKLLSTYSSSTNNNLLKTRKLTGAKLTKALKRDALIKYLLSTAKPDLIPQIGFYTLSGPNHHHVIKTTTLTIGSSPDCDITIDYKEIYPEHLRIEYEDGEFVLVVLGRLGLMLNNQYYAYNRRVILEFGDRIKVMEWQTTFLQ